MKTINDFPSWFARQKLSGKLFVGCAGLVLFACCFGVLSSIFANPEQPTQSPSPTVFVSTATVVILPTATISRTTVPTGSVLIISVNKVSEYVDIQNKGAAPVNLKGWRLVSEKGNQACSLSGDLQPGETLRIWAQGGNSTGFSCGFSRSIWNNDTVDPAVLYNPQGQAVSRYP